MIVILVLGICLFNALDCTAFSRVMKRVPMNIRLAPVHWSFFLPGGGFALYWRWRQRMRAGR